MLNINNLNSRLLRVDKRIRFVISTGLMSLLILISTFFFFDKAIFFIPILMLTCYLVTYFSLLEGIEKIEWSMLFFMPLVITLSFYVYYFLFPVRWLTRIPFVILYSIAIYAALLCSNIFNVGVEKSLQLYRAAFSVNVLFQVMTAYLLFNIIFSFKFIFIVNIFLVFLTVYLLSLQLIWTLKLELSFNRQLFIFSLLIALVISELSGVVAFIPLESNIAALFLTSTYYSISGVILNYLNQKLFKETLREYLIVLFFVFLICLFSLSW